MSDTMASMKPTPIDLYISKCGIVYKYVRRILKLIEQLLDGQREVVIKNSQILADNGFDHELLIKIIRDKKFGYVLKNSKQPNYLVLVISGIMRSVHVDIRSQSVPIVNAGSNYPRQFTQSEHYCKELGQCFDDAQLSIDLIRVVSRPNIFVFNLKSEE